MMQLESHMRHMKACCQAHVRVHVGGGAVGIEDAAVLRLAPDLTPIRAAALTVDLSIEITNQYLETAYIKPPPQFTSMEKVTPRTIKDLGWHKEALLHSTLLAQAGQLSYAVAALCIWVRTNAGRWVTSRLPVHLVPLDQWPDVVKPVMVQARQYGQLFGDGPTEWEHVFDLRKLIALCGRTQEQADWKKEHDERTTLTSAKAAYDSVTGKIGGPGYRRHRDHHLERVAQVIVRSLASSGGSIDEHWEERWTRTPHGTTSLGADIKEELRGTDPNMDWQMRATKPTAAEVMTKDDLLSWCSQTPRCEARGSTKPEPGLKKRALLAVDDCTAWIAGYASYMVEGATKHGGMVLRQDPSDVAEWVAFDQGEPVWRVSNDYDNFNILHSLRSLAEVDIKLANEWDKVPFRWARDKAAASRWVAASYHRAFMRTPHGDARVICGLWSGHRNTARDNTILHLVYLECTLSVMRALFGKDGNAIKRRLCGDDETVAYRSWAAAVCHTLVTDALGFKSQVSKGLLARNRDEFLQLMRHAGNLPTYPVAHTILTFCSGNWYKDNVRDLESTIKDVSDHVWSMVLGGLRMKDGRQLAGYVLDYLMQIKDMKGGLEAVSWWPYRGCGLKDGHPLWGLPGSGFPRATLTRPRLAVPTNATNDGLAREWKVWEQVPRGLCVQAARGRAWEAYKSVTRHWLQQEKDKAYGLMAPRREGYTRVHGYSKVGKIPVNRWRSTSDRNVVRSVRAAARGCGFPPELLGTRYGLKAMTMLRPRDRARLAVAQADQQSQTRGWRWYVVPLLRG